MDSCLNWWVSSSSPGDGEVVKIFLTSVLSGIWAMWPHREEQWTWTITKSCGCLVVRLNSSFHTWRYHLIPNSIRKRHWSRASILSISLIVTAQHSEPYRKMGRIQVLYSFSCEIMRTNHWFLDATHTHTQDKMAQDQAFRMCSQRCSSQLSSAPAEWQLSWAQCEVFLYYTTHQVQNGWLTHAWTNIRPSVITRCLVAGTACLKAPRQSISEQIASQCFQSVQLVAGTRAVAHYEHCNTRDNIGEPHRSFYTQHNNENLVNWTDR